jgi:hypothetical protein
MSEINVVSTTQRIVVDPFSSAVAVINAGPMGPAGPPGPLGPPGPGTPDQYVLKTDFDKAPKGVIAYAQIIATVTLVNTTPTAIPGLSVTVNGMLTTRKYMVEAKLSSQSTVINDIVRHMLTTDGAQCDLGQVILSAANAFDGPTMLKKFYNGGIAGNHTFSVSSCRFTGSGVATAVAQSGIPLYIMVTDLGAV